MITHIKGHGEKFTRQKESAIIGLLTEPTLDEAAKYAHVSSTTLWRWQQDPVFQAEYREARRQATARALAKLQQASFTAVKTLQEIMEDPKASASARVAAARTVLEMGLRSTEVEERDSHLSALERLYKPFEATLLDISFEKRVLEEACLRVTSEDIELVIAWFKSGGEPTPEQEEAAKRLGAARAEATARLTAAPSEGPTTSKMGPGRSGQSRAG
jgi:hypothetical protein